MPHHDPTGILEEAAHPRARTLRVPGKPWSDGTNRLGLLVVALLLVQVPLAVVGLHVSGDGIVAFFAEDYETYYAGRDLTDLLANVRMGLVLVTAAPLVVWLARVRGSDRSDPTMYMTSRVTAVWVWFVPLVSAVLGPVTLFDVWAGTKSAARRDGREVGGVRLTTALLVLWTLAWAAMQFLPLLGRELGTSSQHLRIRTQYEDFVVTSWLAIVAAVALSAFIVRLRAVVRR